MEREIPISDTAIVTTVRRGTQKFVRIVEGKDTFKEVPVRRVPTVSSKPLSTPQSIPPGAIALPARPSEIRVSPVRKSEVIISPQQVIVQPARTPQATVIRTPPQQVIVQPARTPPQQVIISPVRTPQATTARPQQVIVQPARTPEVVASPVRAPQVIVQPARTPLGTPYRTVPEAPSVETPYRTVPEVIESPYRSIPEMISPPRSPVPSEIPDERLDERPNNIDRRTVYMNVDTHRSRLDVVIPLIQNDIEDAGITEYMIELEGNHTGKIIFDYLEDARAFLCSHYDVDYRCGGEMMTVRFE